MYGSAVMYPLAYFKEKIPEYSWIVEYNPMSTIIEMFRYMALGTGEYSITKLLYVIFMSLGFFIVGLIVFNRTEKTFIDTV
jgi:lipopolysaccharide transport system permease protein